MPYRVARRLCGWLLDIMMKFPLHFYCYCLHFLLIKKQHKMLKYFRMLVYIFTRESSSKGLRASERAYLKFPLHFHRSGHTWDFGLVFFLQDLGLSSWLYLQVRLKALFLSQLDLQEETGQEGWAADLLLLPALSPHCLACGFLLGRCLWDSLLVETGIWVYPLSILDPMKHSCEEWAYKCSSIFFFQIKIQRLLLLMKTVS